MEKPPCNYQEKKNNFDLFEKDINEWSDDELQNQLASTLYKEKLYGRSEAIKELMSLNYQILPDEGTNPFKELINFTILAFENVFKFNIDKTVIEYVQNHFPEMYMYIFMEIKRRNPKLFFETKSYERRSVNVEACYDEFIDFVCNYFKSIYPIESDRRKELSKYFKYNVSGIMLCIQTEMNKQSEVVTEFENELLKRIYNILTYIKR